MSEVQSLESIINSAKAEPAVHVQPEQQSPQEEQINTPEEVINTTEKIDASDSISTNMPTDGMDNLSALVKDITSKADEAKENYEAVKAEENAMTSEDMNEILASKGNFNDDIIEIEEPEETVVEEVKEEKQEDKPVEDLSSIKIIKSKRNGFAKDRFKDILKQRKKDGLTFQTVLVNSGYSSNVSGFSSPEINNINTRLRNSDLFTGNDYLYHKIYEHMVDTSVGHMTYEEFLRCTSLLELNTLFYGLFNGTYPDVNEYPAECDNPDCKGDLEGKKTFKFKYDSKRIMYVEGDKEAVSDMVLKVLKAGSPKELLEKSNVNTLVRCKLSSGTIIDFRHPSLYNQLHDTLEQLTEEMVRNLIKDDETVINLMPFVENIYVYDKENNGYLELEDFADRYLELFYLNDKDLEKCSQEISKIMDSYKIKFGLRNVTCPYCGKKIEDTEISNVSQLIFLMHQMKLNGEK